MQSNRYVVDSASPLSFKYDLTMKETKKQRELLGDRVSEIVISRLANRIAITKAAAAIHRSPAFIMTMINEGTIKAYRIGGSAKKPWLVVDLFELLEAMDRETVYVPPVQIRRRTMMRARPIGKPLHPAAASI